MPGQFTIVRQSNTSLELIAKQTEAQEWIQNVLNVHFPSDDFAVSIEDGVLLCRLALAIKPGSIKKINSSPLKFKMMENLTYFVQACRQLGVVDGMLFDPSDMTERRNMMKVVNCIHSLADIATKIGFQPQMEKLIPDNWTFQNTMLNSQQTSKDFANETKVKSTSQKKVTISEIDLDEDLLLESIKKTPKRETDEIEDIKKKREELLKKAEEKKK